MAGAGPGNHYSGDRAAPALTLVVGSGASAVTAVAGLQQLGRDRGGVGVVWLTRRPGPPCTELEEDPLPERAALYKLGNQLAAGQVEGGGLDYFRYLGGWAVERLEEEGAGILVTVRGPAGRRETLQVDRPALDHIELRCTALFSA